MRVASIPKQSQMDFNHNVELSEEMASNMRVSFYAEGQTFQSELKRIARHLKTDVFQLYVNLLFWKVYESRTKFIKDKVEASNWSQYYQAIARGVDPNTAKEVLGLTGKDEPNNERESD